MTLVLVVDDEDAVRDVVAEMLRRCGYEIVTAASPEVARRHLDDPALGLVLSDLALDGLSGLELLGEVRQRRQDLPVLLMTGAGDRRTVESVLASGANGLLRKPFTHAELREAVARALERPGKSEAATRGRGDHPGAGARSRR